MNPSIVHSKRFLVHEADYTVLAQAFPDTEYLIEFLLPDLDGLDEFSASYLGSGLPKRGPTLDLRLFKLMNALTDGMVAGVVIILSILLMAIAILCLRLTITAAIEEDYRQIGVLKAVGMANGDIRSLYLYKYIIVGGLASAVGYLASLPSHGMLSEDVLLNLGQGPMGIVKRAIPLGAAGCVCLAVTAACFRMSGRFNRISAVEALRSSVIATALKNRHFLAVHLNKVFEINIFLGIRDVIQRFRHFGLLAFIYFFCSFTMIIPVHLLSTIKSPDFISYMGIGRSDIRIDLRQTDELEKRFKDIVARIAADEDIELFSPLVSALFTVVRENGEREAVIIETGNFSLFPLTYMEGKEPRLDDDLALSYLKAKDMGLRVGDAMVVSIDDRERPMTVCGIYQDVTNGGRTAKAAIPYDPESVLWYNLSLDVRPGASIERKVREYAEVFQPARITDIGSYLEQTFGGTISRIRRVTLIAILVGLIISSLITTLFLGMIISKDASRIATMKSIGFSLRALRIQYLTAAIVLLGLGIAAGTVFSGTAGQGLVGMLGASIGASRIRFVIDGFSTFVLIPLLLLLAVSLTAAMGIRGIKDNSIAATIAE